MCFKLCHDCGAACHRLYNPSGANFCSFRPVAGQQITVQGGPATDYPVLLDDPSTWTPKNRSDLPYLDAEEEPTGDWYHRTSLFGGPGPVITDNVWGVNEDYFSTLGIYGPVVEETYTAGQLVNGYSIDVATFGTGWFHRSSPEEPPCYRVRTYSDPKPQGTTLIGSDEIPDSFVLTFEHVPVPIDKTNSYILDSRIVDPHNPRVIYYNSTVGPNTVPLDAIPPSLFNVDPSFDLAPNFRPNFVTDAGEPSGRSIDAAIHAGVTVLKASSNSIAVTFRDGVWTADVDVTAYEDGGIVTGHYVHFEIADVRVTGTMPRIGEHGQVVPAGVASYPDFQPGNTTLNAVIPLDDWNDDPEFYDNAFLNKPSPLLGQNNFIGVHGFGTRNFPLLLAEVDIAFWFTEHPSPPPPFVPFYHFERFRSQAGPSQSAPTFRLDASDAPWRSADFRDSLQFELPLNPEADHEVISSIPNETASTVSAGTVTPTTFKTERVCP